jgi:hypothetical protein
VEKTPFDALEKAVEGKNFPVADYIYKRIKLLTNKRHDLLVDTAIVNSLPDILEMLLEGINKISDESVEIEVNERSSTIREVIRRLVAMELNCGPIKCPDNLFIQIQFIA